MDRFPAVARCRKNQYYGQAEYEDEDEEHGAKVDDCVVTLEADFCKLFVRLLIIFFFGYSWNSSQDLTAWHDIESGNGD